MTRKEQLTYMLDKVENGLHTPDSDRAIRFARRRGITSNMHAGNSKEWFEEDRDNRVAEWLMGQLIDCYEHEHFFSYVSCVNLSRSFLEGEY